ncbi:MAG: hypothetical protein LBV75_09790, partial [Paludibacter sp.]|nr:hypothetical protein [Paludibacter sp.]
MKRFALYILISSMLVTLAGLIILQVRYFNLNVQIVENQFNESVRRCLFQTVYLVEENEALQYLHQTLEGYDYQGSRKLNEYSTFSVPQI